MTGAHSNAADHCGEDLAAANDVDDDSDKKVEQDNENGNNKVTMATDNNNGKMVTRTSLGTFRDVGTLGHMKIVAFACLIVAFFAYIENTDLL